MSDIPIMTENIQYEGKRKEIEGSEKESSKKLCTATSSTSESDKEIPKLETRLGGILCCAVCLDLPPSLIYQCSNGHIMCASCFNHILADARIKDECCICPNCRSELSRTVCIRNLAVENAVRELPQSCSYCSVSYPRYMIEEHETKLCSMRTTLCKYKIIGCSWVGPNSSSIHHEDICEQPTLPGSKIIPYLESQNKSIEKEGESHSEFMKLLSADRVMFNDVTLRPYRTEEFVTKLHYETGRFQAFSYTFTLYLRLNDDRKDSHLSTDRYLSYRLLLKTKLLSQKLMVYFSIVKGPIGDLKIKEHVSKFEFTENNVESDWMPLPLKDSNECNRVLANRSIDARIILGQIR